MYKLFSWEHSYFSGKVRAYLRFKHRNAALGEGYEDILATPDLIQGLLIPRSGSGAIPQIEAPDGTWVQDSSEIIDFCEAAHPEARVIPDPRSRPRQCLASYLIELLADEWMVVPGFWERWYFSEDDRALSHRGFNEQQWGAVIAPGAAGDARRAGTIADNVAVANVGSEVPRMPAIRDIVVVSRCAAQRGRTSTNVDSL